jgi:hypothetical protein
MALPRSNPLRRGEPVALGRVDASCLSAVGVESNGRPIGRGASDFLSLGIRSGFGAARLEWVVSRCCNQPLGPDFPAGVDRGCGRRGRGGEGGGRGWKRSECLSVPLIRDGPGSFGPGWTQTFFMVAREEGNDSPPSARNRHLASPLGYPES